jgi:hypothetical protein
MTRHFQLDSGDLLEIEPREFNGPLVHIGHDGAAFSKVRLTVPEALAFAHAIVSAVDSGRFFTDPVGGLLVCRHGHALCSICNVKGRNTIPEETSSRG